MINCTMYIISLILYPYDGLIPISNQFTKDMIDRVMNDTFFFRCNVYMYLR